MQDKDVRSWLALHRTAGLPDSQLRRLINATNTAEEIYQLGLDEFHALKIPSSAQSALNKPIDQAQLERDYTLVQQQCIQLVPLNSPQYPALLRQTNDAPPLLYVKGRVELLNQPQLAMVGSRNTSRQGCENAFRFAREFAGAGLTVTSGLALGIDTESHKGALASAGNTIAVLGTGVDQIYPARNGALYEQIATAGAIVSEFPLATGPRRNLFPRRNRIISGMSLGVLVVEAALKSGSLITARCALEQGREVFAIPGSIHSTGSQGCHALIQQGAKLVQNALDVVEELQGWLPSPPIQVIAEASIMGVRDGSSVNPVGAQQNIMLDDVADVMERELLELLGFDPAPVELLQQRSGWVPSELISVLTTLELKGLVENRSGCYLLVARE
ncbi:MAG: DNA-processing protein DprA [Spongiibacteraceae bacterium]